MAIKLKHNDSYSTYFITYTCVKWISLVEMTNIYDMVYKWFAILKEQYNADVIASVTKGIYNIHVTDDVSNFNKKIIVE